jgi:putative endopeptidase
VEADRKDTHAKAGSDERKIGDLYASFMDDKRRATLGYKPLAGELQRIRNLKDKKGVPALVAHLNRIGVATPYAINIGQDAKASTRYAVYVRQGGLGMPDRDYYLKLDDAKLAATRASYQQHVAKTLALAGDKDAEARAAAIVGFETELARVQSTKVELRDPNKNYNKVDMAALAALTPGYDWKSALAEAGVASRIDYAIVGQPGYLQAFDPRRRRPEHRQGVFRMAVVARLRALPVEGVRRRGLRLLRPHADRRRREPGAVEDRRVHRRRVDG